MCSVHTHSQLRFRPAPNMHHNRFTSFSSIFISKSCNAKLKAFALTVNLDHAVGEHIEPVH